ncbi:MAG: hypothetical protein D6677_04940 [Calditrichaeota bacterium]|nr:MAG: hypothetical protein D6677_04940 [Calditrichota bacterium]
MLSRSLEKARHAYKTKDIEALRVAHDEHGDEPHGSDHGQYIKSAVYGGLDGIITTFAVVAGVAGASLSAGVVLILGFANLIADGLSMAIGDFLSTRAENEYKEAEYQREKWEFRNYPEGEKKEMIELYMAKGISEEDARTVVDIISKDEKAWLSIMMVEELGLLYDLESPLKNAVVTFFSFALFGFVPLVVPLLNWFHPGMVSDPFLASSLITGLTLFVLGALKSIFTERHWFISGLEMFIVGSIAASAAYWVGDVLGGLA